MSVAGQVPNPQSPIAPKQEEAPHLTGLSRVSGHAYTLKWRLIVLSMDGKLVPSHYVGQKSYKEAPMETYEHQKHAFQIIGSLKNTCHAMKSLEQ